MGFFCLSAAMMLPRATIEVDRSTFTGNPFPVGNDAAIGLVPKKASLDPSGDIAGSQFVIASRMNPFSAIRLQ